MGGKQAVVISRKSVNNLSDCAEVISAHLGGRNIVDVRQLLKELRGRVDLNNSDGWTFLLASTPQLFYMRVYFYLKTILEPVLAVAVVEMAVERPAVLSMIQVIQKTQIERMKKTRVRIARNPRNQAKARRRLPR